MVEPLGPDDVYRRCPTDSFQFRDTSELETLDLLTAHRRAVDALDFGTEIESDGYNLFVLGDPGAGKHALVSRFLKRRAAEASVPPDWCYIYNFDEPSRPRYLKLPPGTGRKLRQDLDQLVEDLRTAIPAVFESEEYQNRVHELERVMQRRQREGLEAVRREAREHDIVMLTTPAGFTFAPAKGDGIMEPEEFQKLSDQDRQRIERTMEILQRKLQQTIQQMPRLARELRQQVNALNEEMIQAAIGGPLEELYEAYRDQEGVIAHLEAIRNFIVEHVNAFVSDNPDIPPEAIFSRCRINLLVDNGDCRGAPVVYQDLPTHQHLVGRIEHHVRNGALLTDFSLIRPGALHRANGGYLLLDVRGVLMQPASWETLKRNLRAREICTESLEQAYGLISTVSLEPQPIPLDVKIVLMGDRLLYYLLSHYDPEFLELFKVQADLEDDLDRDDESQLLFARMIATLARDAGLRPLDPSGVAAVIEQASRLADDQKKVTARTRELGDLLREASYWAGKDGAGVISRTHVSRAVAQQVYRAERLRVRSLEAISRGTVMIATEGEAPAQVNGLSVLQLGSFAFGRPTRITATARPGKGQVVDIEREAKLGGPIHSKAVMILSRFLASRYAADGELSLSASLAFEQSYGGIEGDSASVAEVCALISAITRVPLRQSLAVTGSINQHGDVQAVGGVNQKVEGFFDVCAGAGTLDGHGVLLPASNVTHLMLRSDVREAVGEGRFRIYPVRTVDEALELLTGRPAGEPDADGVFPEDSLNRLVVERLQGFARAVRPREQGDQSGGRNHDD
ncbi:MAG: AAA family ATPase [Ectothiorhodospiraceae bacterium]|nr:AAA family ATPase [Ectothiorhodospiraceae bacterium]